MSVMTPQYCSNKQPSTEFLCVVAVRAVLQAFYFPTQSPVARHPPCGTNGDAGCSASVVQDERG
jgi:hypothetical protein